MKELLAIIIVVVLAMSVSACGNSIDKERSSSVMTDVSDDTDSSKAAESVDSDISSGQETEEDSLCIDLEALGLIEKEDNFALKVKEKQAVEGLFDNGSAVVDLNGEDGLVITIENLLDTNVEEFTILILCTDANGKGCDLGGLASPSNVTISGGKVISYSNYVKTMGTTTAGLKANSNKEFSIQCKLGEIENVNAIIYSYKNADGKEVVNENCEEWLTNTLEAKVH